MTDRPYYKTKADLYRARVWYWRSQLDRSDVCFSQANRADCERLLKRAEAKLKEETQAHEKGRHIDDNRGDAG